MTIGFTPFLTADVDESSNLASRWSPVFGPADGVATAAHLELIRRRVVMGYYLSPNMATETARRLLERELSDDQ